MTKRKDKKPVVKRVEIQETDADLFQALGQITRLHIWRLLRDEGPTPVGKIAKSAGVSQPAVSFHLLKMRMCGLLLAARQGRERLYGVNVDALNRIGAVL